jgi:RNA polymerase sigma-70 factor, ECF subfamily
MMSLIPDPRTRPPVEAVALPSPLSNHAPVGDPVLRARDGDLDAFETLYREHGGRVMALCLRMCPHPAEAEELAQDVWVRAWEKLASFRGESAFTTWLHRLAVNVILERRRREGRHRARFESVAETSTHEALPSNPTGSALGFPGVRLDLERAVAMLPEGARTVFVLYDVEGYRHSEIAESMGVAEGTVKSQLHRARRMLREALER